MPESPERSRFQSPTEIRNFIRNLRLTSHDTRRTNFSRRRNFLYSYQNQPELIKQIVKNNVNQVKRILRDSKEHWSISDQNRRTPLHLASSLGHTEIVDLLIRSESYSVNCRDAEMVTPLHRACRNGHLETVRLLVAHQADCNARTKQHVTPLHLCAMCDSVACAETIIQYVTCVDSTDSNGATALHHAVQARNATMVKFLLNHNANVEVQDKCGQRPIHYAAGKNSPELVKILALNGQADVNVRNKDLLTPLHFAVVFGCEEAFNALLECQASLDTQDMQGNTLAHYAAFYGNERIFQALASRMATNTPNLNGLTPLHYACCSRISGAVSLWLMNEHTNQDIDVEDRFKRTPLHYAAVNSLPDVANELLTRGAKCDVSDVVLETPLHKAIQSAHRQVFQVLREHGAQLDLQNKDGFTGLHLSVMADLPHLCKLLIESGANPTLCDSSGRTPHYLAAYTGSFECFFQLLASSMYYAMLDSVSLNLDQLQLFPPLDAFKRSPLHYAAASKTCAAEFLQFFLAQRPLDRFNELHLSMGEVLRRDLLQININQEDIFKRTPLHYLCRRRLEVEVNITHLVRILLESGADPSVMDSDNFLPFHYAVANGYNNVVSLLIRKEWFQEPEQYRYIHECAPCPLRMAAYYGHANILPQLIDIGFKSYETALQIAVSRFNWDCVTRLLPHVRRASLIIYLIYYTVLKGALIGLKIFFEMAPSKCNPNHLLLVAASSKHGASCVQFLLDMGANIDTRDRMGRNVLFYAMAGRNQETLKLLLFSGAKFIKDDRGHNVFHLIGSHGDVELLSFLHSIASKYGFYQALYSGMMLKDNDGFSPLEMAAINRHQSLIEFYMTHVNKGYGVQCRMLLFSGLCGNITLVEYLLTLQGPMHLQVLGNLKRNILHYAFMSPCSSAIALIEHVYRENSSLIDMRDQKMMTPWMVGAWFGNHRVLRHFLRDSHQDFRLYDLEGNNILHLACMSGRNKMAQLILSHSSDVGHLMRQKNSKKQTPLHLAAQNSLHAVVHQLLQYGANPSEEDARGYTPSLYCTHNSDAAYTLLIIESYLEFPDPPPEETAESDVSVESTNSSVNTSNQTVSTSSSSLRLSRRSLPSHQAEDRIRRLSLQAFSEKFQRLSINDSPRPETPIPPIHQSVEGVNAEDSDSEMY